MGCQPKAKMSPFLQSYCIPFEGRVTAFTGADLTNILYLGFWNQLTFGTQYLDDIHFAGGQWCWLCLSHGKEIAVFRRINWLSMSWLILHNSTCKYEDIIYEKFRIFFSFVLQMFLFTTKVLPLYTGVFTAGRFCLSHGCADFDALLYWSSK